MEADGAVDAQNAPTAPWKTLLVFHELPQGVPHQITHDKPRKSPESYWETRIDPKFRTLGSPQYGFKASLSDRACRHGASVKPVPGIPDDPRRLPPSFAALSHQSSAWVVSQARWHVGRPLCERPPPLYPRGPWLRAELCCLSPSSRTTTPSASLAGTRRLHGCTAYTSRLRCAGTPRQPTRPSLLSLLHCPHVPPTLRRRVRDVVLLHERRDTRLPRRLSESPPAQCPSLPAIPDGDGFSTLHRSLYAAARAFAKPSRLATTKGITRDAFGLLRYRVTPAFDAGRHRPALGVRLGGRTGNLPPSGLAPD